MGYIMTLIPGKMNVLLTICKPGYAEGVRRPRRKKIAKPFNPIFEETSPRILLRKAA
jgi:hypothetical protein